MKKEIKLYEVFFPIWFLFMLPEMWMLTIPVSILAGGIGLYIGLRQIGFKQPKTIWKRTFVWIAISNFLSYFIAGVIMFTTQIINFSGDAGVWFNENIAYPLSLNPFRNVFSFLFALVAIACAGLFLYFFNSKIAFRKTELSRNQKYKLSLFLAIFCAPYFALYPTELLFSGVVK